MRSMTLSSSINKGRLALKNDPRTPWTGAALLDQFIELNNLYIVAHFFFIASVSTPATFSLTFEPRVLDRFTAEERRNIGIHTCPGGDSDSVHSYDVAYHKLLPSLFRINAGYFLIQLASEKDKEGVYKLIGENIRKDAKGVKQVRDAAITQSCFASSKRY